MQLKQQVYLSLLGAIILPLTISSYMFSSSIQSFVETKVIEQDLPTVLSDVRNAIELELAGPILTSKGIAENTFIEHWMNKGEPASELDTVTQYLDNLQKKNSAITSFIVSKKTSNYYTADGVSRQISQNSDDWFYAFINGNKAFELSLDIDKALGKAAVFINYAISINGKRQALGGIGRSLESMTDLIKSYSVGDTGFVYMVDATGEIKLHPEVKKIGQIIDLKSIQSQKNSTLNHHDQDWVVASTPLKSLDWHLVAEVPKDELYGAINSAIFDNILMGIFITLVGLCLTTILAKKIFKPIEEMTVAVNELAEQDGDLTARLPVKGTDELSQLSQQFNLFLEKLHNMFKQVSVSAVTVKQLSGEVNIQVNSAANLADGQSHSTQIVAAAVNEMEATVGEISNSAVAASETASNTQNAAVSGHQFVDQTIEEMVALEQNMSSAVQSVSELSEEIFSIRHVLDVIKGISEQTNLLALNAAIEAARAGEQGRGFAVVADEVRTLAKRTADSTEEINKMIVGLNDKSGLAVQAIDAGSAGTQSASERLRQTGETLANIAKDIINVTDTSAHVASATKEQTTATAEINHNILSIANSADDTKLNMEESTRLCNNLALQADHLEALMGKFTI